MANRILIVEDERWISRILVDSLQEEHYSAIPAYSGQEGFACLQKSSFDLILLDLKLPDVDGLDMLRQIQAALPEVKVLVLIKPIPIEEVLKIIPGLLHNGYRRRKTGSDLPKRFHPGRSFLDSSWVEQ